jgi:uncharacterized membrane protein YfcA
LTGWIVTAIAILLTGISKSGLGGALGGLAVPFMSMWLSPRDAVAVMLPVLITMDMVGIRAWRARPTGRVAPADARGAGRHRPRHAGFGVMSDRVVKGAIG